MKNMKVFVTMDDYIKSFPKDIQALLKQMRKTIKNAAPKLKARVLKTKSSRV